MNVYDGWRLGAPEAERQWYIDAWAVFDGYAFASLRTPGAIDAAVTFFLAPPYFEPEPVASLATALAATRGCFQEGVRNADGEEVSFASLEQVIEAVRRAYRAGGLNLSGPTPAAPAQPREPQLGEVQPDELVEPQMSADWDDLLSAILHGRHPRSGDMASAWTQLVRHAMPRLVLKFIGASIVDAIAALSRTTEMRSVRARSLAGWIHRATQLGLRTALDHAEARVVLHWQDDPEGYYWQVPELSQLPPSLVDHTHPVLYRTAASVEDSLALPFAVPIPFLFQADTSRKYAPVQTLGHLHAAATADAWYLRSIQGMHEAVPLIVLALLQVPSADLPFPAFPPLAGTPEAEDLAHKAGTWLASALPSALLRGHWAEDQLHAIVSRLLRRGLDEDVGMVGATRS